MSPRTPRTTQIFCASTLYGAVTLAAAIDSDLFEEAERRVLLVFNNTATPETSLPLDAMPGFAPLRDHFDEVLSWNEAIRPFHPGSWTPRPDDIPLFERYLRLLWGLGEDRVELVLESLQVAPALTVAQIFTGAPVDVYADGLMSYGPTRNKLDPLVGTRVRRLLHLDLIAGLTPMLLTEFGVPPVVVPTSAFLKAMGELTDTVEELPSLQDNAALLLGQYLSALDILSPVEEENLHVRMLKGAVAKGHRSIVFKPHPSAPARFSRALEAEAEKLGVDLTVLDTPVLAEVLFEKARPALVVGCFSTALFTASALYDLPTARIGTELLLERLTPYQNSNRVPVVLADAVLADLEGRGSEDAIPAGDLNALVTAVGFTMQPQIHPSLRPAAERYLSKHYKPRTQRYFKRKRLTSLGLPGGIPERLSFLPRSSTARRVVRRARALKKAVKR
ncbi:alpha-2,8-polysialyltransferase family protein [Streptomyces doebereineriae]|uniref:Alpha-2,8-polysialyltransferase family protein n=1 Tax=Streptomyces doebereineriae TaxID=3075528 RepID=A0ABU2VMJ4_9ACTN|nr:alpha-2,8-polysialyltransferase family protein [Streptomyces sp. DSM 41640]MDT0486316.1 alpha-2,8-polysialyltransferase family protein [Streptomyces sp. DSM 41640]